MKTSAYSSDPARPLTPAMLDALRKAGTADGIGSWDYASGILGALKAAGLVIRGADGRYRTTDVGRARLTLTS